MHGTDDKVVLSNHLIDDFCEKYKFYIPESNKNFYSPGDLKAFLRARLDFFLNRKEEIKILVENQGDKFIWLANSSSIEILMPDSPFIVDTILDTCMSHGHMINLVIHPIFRVFRNEDGDLQAIDYPDGDGDAESYVYVEMSRLSPQARRRLRQDLAGNLKELRIAVADYPKMRILVNDVVFQREELNEHLAWIKDNFVFLGLSSINKNELGRPFHGLMKKQSLRNTISQEISNQNGKAGPELTCYQSAARSIVNKDREMFFFVMRCKKLNLLLAGHFRHRAELSLRHDIPAVKRMLDLMAQEMRVPSTSYMYKELYKAAQALPVGILMTRSSSFLFKWFSKILANVYSIEFSYEITLDQKGDFVWALILVPPEDRGKVPGREFEAYCESQKIRTLYQFRHTLNQREVVFLGLRSETLSPKQLQAELLVNAGDLFSAWMSRFQESIISRYSGEEIDIKLRRYMVGVSAEYEIHQSPEDALFDLEMLDEMTPDSGYVVYYSDETGQENDFIKIYSLRPARLSDIIPVLSNFGFRIDREYTFPFQENGSSRYAYAFTVRRREKLTRQDRERIAFCISEVLNKRMTSRILNELVLVSGLDHRELLLVKALCGYFVQIDKSHYNTSLQTTLVRYPKVARALVDFFEVRLDPAKSSSEAEKARQSVEKCFKDLSSVQDEKICRTLLNIVEAIVRTNFFMGLPEICFKIRSRAIDRMPSPAPHYEIYVYSYDLQGVHLRGGRVARGGIRWSDRLDDYRTEILGLMKAQMVKNTVIVPTGSKGGFVLRNRKDTMVADIRKAGEEGYKRFIGCLLDLTDSYDSDGNVIAPKDIKRLDDDDPYLVVAADKGTATFSDLANEISTKKGFWLDDAFASGGSNGYDHKKQGITAKGTWESVKRHFFEIGIDPEKDNITVVGIGDMSGDVFGNGMLLSRTIRLVAAFNHAFIFLDPTPDPEISFQERKRLFYQGGNWDDYNKEVLSAGGGIYERSSRRIELSAEVRHLLNLKSRTLSGEDLIHSILQAPADLLWNGGIGTYVKASNESQFQAGDSANDRVRIDASELNVRVVGEGGNLGLTQAARVEAAKRGVRLNSDAIDNFAGVNMSDHEVNLKILLNGLVTSGQIKDKAERNRMIRAAESEEIDLVLRQNYALNLSISVDAKRMPEQFLYLRALIKYLNSEGLFDRAADCIPFEAELDRLEESSRMIPRPIQCALVGFTKLYGKRLLLKSQIFDDPWYERFLLNYFPCSIRQNGAEAINKHPLKREIIVTEVANEIINNGGMLFMQRMVMSTGKMPDVVADAYLRLTEFIEASGLRNPLASHTKWLNASLQYEYLIFLEEKIFRIAQKLLQNPNLMALLVGEDRDIFRQLLLESARHSTFRIPRKLRITLKMFPAEDADAIVSAFKRADTLEDAFNIFINNKQNNTDWHTFDYFTTLQQYRIKELRSIIRDLKTVSSWELLFVSKVEAQIEALITSLLSLKSGPGEKDSTSRKHKVRNSANDMISMHRRGELSLAAMYEMLLYLNQRIRP